MPFDLATWMQGPVMRGVLDAWERQRDQVAAGGFRSVNRDVIRSRGEAFVAALAALARGEKRPMEEHLRLSFQTRMSSEFSPQQMLAVAHLFYPEYLSRLAAACPDPAERAQAERVLAECFYGMAECFSMALWEVLDRAYRELDRRHEEISRLSRDRELFTSFLLHDLKNPVTIVKANLDPFKEAAAGDPDLAGALTDARTGVDRILDIAGRMLDVVQLEDGALPFHPAELSGEALLRDLSELWKAPAAAKQVAVTLDTVSFRLKADPELLRRVLENFLENALRYTPTRGEIRVLGRTGPEEARFTVWDSGKPVEPSLRERVFDKYWRDPSGGSRMSRGLGLHFCRLVAERHGGRAWTDEEGGGCAFHLALPLALAGGPPR